MRGDKDGEEVDRIELIGIQVKSDGFTASIALVEAVRRLSVGCLPSS